jgi:hypothetical protein
LWQNIGMAEPINLNKARKAKAKTAAQATAAANRALHGRTRAEKLRDRTERDTREALLDGAKREPSARDAE